MLTGRTFFTQNETYEHVQEVAELICKWYVSMLPQYVTYGRQYVNLNERKEFAVRIKFNVISKFPVSCILFLK